MQGYDGCLIFKWTNGEKYSGLVNFIPELHLPFAQISSFYWKTAAKAWN